MDTIMNVIRSEFMEVVLRRDGQLNKEQIDFINEYTQFVAERLETVNEGNSVYE